MSILQKLHASHSLLQCEQMDQADLCISRWSISTDRRYESQNRRFWHIGRWNQVPYYTMTNCLCWYTNQS